MKTKLALILLVSAVSAFAAPVRESVVRPAMKAQLVTTRIYIHAKHSEAVILRDASNDPLEKALLQREINFYVFWLSVSPASELDKPVYNLPL